MTGTLSIPRSYKYGMARGMAVKFGSALVRMGACKGDVMGMVGLLGLFWSRSRSCSRSRSAPAPDPAGPPQLLLLLLQVLPNIPEFPLAFLGAAGAGLAVTTFNPTYRSPG